MSNNNYLKILNKLDPNVLNIKVTNQQINNTLDLEKFKSIRNLNCNYNDIKKIINLPR
jgi:hypothetical protein